MNRLVFRVEIETTQGRETHFVESPTLIIGRSEEAQILCDHRGVSRQHLIVTAVGSQVFIQDMGTSNGTIMNGISLAPQSRTPYTSGDLIKLGTCDYKFYITLLRSEIDPHEEAAQIIRKGQDDQQKLLRKARADAEQIVQDGEKQRALRLAALENEVQEKKRDVLKEIENERQSFEKERENIKAEALELYDREKSAIGEKLEARKKQKVLEINSELEKFFRDEKARQIQLAQKAAENELSHHKQRIEIELRARSEAGLSQSRAKAQAEFELTLEKARSEAKQLKETADAAIALSHAELENRRREVKAELTQLDAKRSAVLQEMNHLYQSISTLQQEAQKIHDEKDRMSQNVLDLQEAREDFHRSIEQLKGREEELQLSIETFTQKAQGLQAMESKIRQELSLGELNLNAQRSALSTLESEIETATSKAKAYSSEAIDLENHLLAEKNSRLQEIKAELDIIKNQAAREIGERRRKMTESFKEREKALEQKLAAQELKAIESLKADLEKRDRAWTKDIQAQLTLTAEKISSHLQSDLPRFLTEEDPRAHLQSFQNHTLKIMREVLLGQSDAYIENSEALFEPQFERQAANKKWWRKWAAAVFIVTTSLSLALHYSSDILQALSNRIKESKDNQLSNEFISKIQEKRALRYNPKTTPEYKDTYLKNVMYTSHFSKLFLDQKFQDEWIMTANDFFVKQLGLSDNTIVQFIALEVNLIKKLTEIRAKIHPDHVKEGLDQMIEAEDKTVSEMKILLEGERRFAKFKTFSKDFYGRYLESHSKFSEGSEDLSSELQDSVDQLEPMPVPKDSQAQ